MIYIALLIILLLDAFWIIGLPLIKKRPIVITRKTLIAPVILLLIYSVFAIQNFVLITLAVLLGFILVLVDLSILVGITKEDSMSALQKAMTGLQLQFQTEQNRITCTLPEGYVTFTKLPVGTLSIVTFKLSRGSKKHALLRQVFRKFIDNNNFRF